MTDDTSDASDGDAAIGLVVIALVIAGAIALWIAFTDDGTDDRADESAPASEASRPFKATDKQVKSAVEHELGAKSSDGRPRVRNATCERRRRCQIAYNADEPAFSPEQTVLFEQRPIFEAIFADKRVREVSVVAFAKTMTIGGKEDHSPVMRLECDRDAARQIDWQVVDVEGLKTLCDYSPQVKF